MVAGQDRPALRRCIGVDLDRFAAEHWSRTPLLSRRGSLPQDFTDLLSPVAVDEIVSRRGLRTPFVRMAKDGDVIAAARYTRGGGVGAEVRDQVSDDQVLGLFADGATLVLQGLHRMWPPLVDFAGDLAVDLGHPVQANSYITPPQSRGFSPHYDVHDVFVLQVSGTKRWVVHAPVVQDPLAGQPWTGRRALVADAAVGEPVIDAVLEPGDSLYLPRGWIHSAQALGEVAVHLTLGVHPVTRRTLVEELLAMAGDEPGLRGSLPLGLDLAPPGAQAPEVPETIDALVQWLGAVDVEDLTQRLRTRLWSGVRPAPAGPLAQAARAAALSVDDVVRLRGRLRCSLSQDGDQVVLVLADRRLSLAASTGAALTAVLSGDELRVGDLPGLDAEAAVVLVRRLLREGVVVPAGA